MEAMGTEEGGGTAARLEGISDTNFELLATAVLRRQDDDCRALIHTGLNVDGKPVAAPLDGFVRVPGSHPPLYVLVLHTTTKRRDLPRNWLGGLGGRRGEGDLAKAAREAERIRSEVSDAQFRVLLATNQRVDSSLANSVYVVADQLCVESEIWEQSRFVDFLDHDPDGQWLRQRYLGHQAERLSLELLLDIGTRSLAQYGAEFLHTRPECWVERRFATDPYNSGGTGTLRLLVGESGFGKSATAYAALLRASREGNPVLWVPAEDLARSNSLTEAVDATLRRLHPGVEPLAGHTALNLVPPGKRLVVAVDDLRRLESHDVHLRRLVAWTRPAEDLRPPSPLVLCPVRPGDVREPLGEWVEHVRVGRMSEAEAIAALRASRASPTFDATTLRKLARALACDPIALALFSEVSAEGLDETRLWAVADDVIAAYVDRQVQRIGPSGGTVPEDVDRVLDTLALAMLRNRRLVPDWEEAAAWVASDPEVARLLRVLVRDEALCRLDRTTGRSLLVFRHDRVRDHLLVRALASVLISESPEVLADPAFTFVVAEACARSGTAAGVARLRKEAPLALVAMLRDTPHLPGTLASSVREEVGAWLKTVRDRRGEIPDAERDSISGILVDVDDPVALEVADALRGHWDALVRFRHGDARAAASYCSYTRFLFNPDEDDPALDEALTRALSSERFVADLRALLMKPDSAEIAEGALILAGRAALPELLEATRVCWERMAGEERLLRAALWAGLRCAGPVPGGGLAHLEPLLEAWEARPNPVSDLDHPQYGGEEGFAAAALRVGVRGGVLDSLLARAREKPALRGHLAVALERVDDPAAVEFVARTVAETTRRGSSGEDSLWAFLVCDHLEERKRGGRLSDASVRSLEELWRSGAEDDEVRRQAGRMWMAVMGPAAVPSLQRVAPETPLYRDAVWHRAVHGDRSSVPELLVAFSEGHRWLRVASRVWSPEIRTEVDAVLAGTRSTLPADFAGTDEVHYDLGTLLIQVPAEDAEALLTAHWDHLRHGWLFIQAALRVGTPKTRALAAEAIAAAPAGADLFRYVTHAFLVPERDPKELLRHLEALKPYFERIREQDLVEFARRCVNSGLREWAMERIAPHLTNRERRLLFPTDEDLVLELKEAEAGEPDGWDGAYWIHWLSGQPNGPRRALDAAERFCREDPSPRRYRLLTDAIKRFGTRADLVRLDGIVPAYMPRMAEELARDAKFVVEYTRLE
jgi:hypothetical protein